MLITNIPTCGPNHISFCFMRRQTNTQLPPYVYFMGNILFVTIYPASDSTRFRGTHQSNKNKIDWRIRHRPMDTHRQNKLNEILFVYLFPKNLKYLHLKGLRDRNMGNCTAPQWTIRRRVFVSVFCKTAKVFQVQLFIFPDQFDQFKFQPSILLLDDCLRAECECVVCSSSSHH